MSLAEGEIKAKSMFRGLNYRTTNEGLLNLRVEAENAALKEENARLRLEKQGYTSLKEHTVGFQRWNDQWT